MIIIAIVEMITVALAGVLSLFTPFMLVVAWARVIVLRSNHDSSSVWIPLSVLLFVPIGIVFIVAFFAADRSGNNVSLLKDFAVFNYHPLWWLISLIGFAVLLMTPEKKQIVLWAAILNIILYTAILFSSAAFISGFYAAGEVIQPKDLFSIMVLFGTFANSFVVLAFFLASIFRPSTRTSIYVLVVSLSSSVICTLLVMVFPLHFD